MEEEEEREIELFNPRDTASSAPRNLLEVDQCIEYANEQLYLKLKRSLTQRENSTDHKPTTSTKYFHDLLIEVPIGNFYYPCSGNDFKIPLDVFSEYVDEFHFADPFNKKYRNKNKSNKTHDQISIPWIGNVSIIESYFSVEIYQERQVFFHCKDGLLTLLDEIRDLSIFFYRKDSAGEGGSGQFWLGSVLLDLVLSKIKHGGLLFIDKSNGFGPLFNEFFKLNQILYRNLKLCKIENRITGEFGKLDIWQIHK
jgi:hypothetical protein